MTASLYVVLDKKGFNRSLKDCPSTLKEGEVALQVHIEVPDSAFAPRPVPTVHLVVPEESLIRRIEAIAQPEVER